jgi:hypothetical protein
LGKSTRRFSVYAPGVNRVEFAWSSLEPKNHTQAIRGAMAMKIDERTPASLCLYLRLFFFALICACCVLVIGKSVNGWVLLIELFRALDCKVIAR